MSAMVLGLITLVLTSTSLLAQSSEQNVASLPKYPSAGCMRLLNEKEQKERYCELSEGLFVNSMRVKRLSVESRFNYRKEADAILESYGDIRAQTFLKAFLTQPYLHGPNGPKEAVSDLNKLQPITPVASQFDFWVNTLIAAEKIHHSANINTALLAGLESTIPRLNYEEQDITLATLAGWSLNAMAQSYLDLGDEESTLRLINKCYDVMPSSKPVIGLTTCMTHMLREKRASNNLREAVKDRVYELTCATEDEQLCKIYSIHFRDRKRSN